MEGLLSTGPTPSSFVPLGRDRVTITSFSGIQVVRTRPALYKKTQHYMFDINTFVFRTHLDIFIDVSGLPHRYKNLS